MRMEEFLFYKMGRQRNRSESLHDLLIAAKSGLKKTRIMYGASLSWALMEKQLKFAEAAGLIEEVEIPPSYSRKKPTRGWKTTKKGLKYAQNVYDNSKLLEEAKD